MRYFTNTLLPCEGLDVKAVGLASLRTLLAPYLAGPLACIKPSVYTGAQPGRRLAECRAPQLSRPAAAGTPRHGLGVSGRIVGSGSDGLAWPRCHSDAAAHLPQAPRAARMRCGMPTATPTSWLQS